MRKVRSVEEEEEEEEEAAVAYQDLTLSFKVAGPKNATRSESNCKTLLRYINRIVLVFPDKVHNDNSDIVYGSCDICYVLYFPWNRHVNKQFEGRRKSFRIGKRSAGKVTEASFAEDPDLNVLAWYNAHVPRTLF